MRSAHLVVASIAVLAACSRSESLSSRRDAADATAPTNAAVDAGHAEASRAEVVRDAAVWSRPRSGEAETVEDLYGEGLPTRGKAIGHTSVVFKVTVAPDRDAAYKPRSHRGKERFKGEIAAFRLGRALGLSNVPPAVPRRFRAADLRFALGAATPASQLFDQEVVVEKDGIVRGALIPWIPKLEFIALESAVERARWEPWISGSSPIPEDQRVRVAQISTMIVFDFVIGNWDRWSGANIGIDRATGLLLFVDNDGAFFDPLPALPFAPQVLLMSEVSRFSRRFVAALEGTDLAAMEAALGEESPAVPLLSGGQIRAMGERRARALALVHEKIAAQGEAAVLALP